MRTEKQHNEKRIEIMEKCYECYAEHGLTGTGIKMLAEACGCTQGNLYSYFKNLDELIVESTAYCMAKVEDDFMKKAPTDPKGRHAFYRGGALLDGEGTRKQIPPHVSGLHPSEIYLNTEKSFLRV